MTDYENPKVLLLKYERRFTRFPFHTVRKKSPSPPHSPDPEPEDQGVDNGGYVEFNKGNSTQESTNGEGYLTFDPIKGVPEALEQSEDDVYVNIDPDDAEYEDVEDEDIYLHPQSSPAIKPGDIEYETDPTILICQLLGKFAPPLMSDLLKLLVHKTHAGQSLPNVISTIPDLDKIYRSVTTDDSKQLIKEDYYLLPLDKYGKLDLDQIDAGVSLQSHIRKSRPNEYVDSRSMSAGNIYESLTKNVPTIEERETAMTYFLFTNKQLTGLTSPEGGWFMEPPEPQADLTCSIAYITFLTNNIDELIHGGVSKTDSGLCRLVDSLRLVSKAVQEEFPSPVSIEETLDHVLAINHGIESLDPLITTLHGISEAKNDLLKQSCEVMYQQLDVPSAEIYEEIMEDIYEEIQEDLYDEIPEAAIDKDEEEAKKETEIPKQTQFEAINSTSRQLNEMSIIMCEKKQQQGNEFSEADKEEANVITKGLTKAKESLQSIVTYVKEEIRKLQETIQNRKAEREKKKEERKQRKRDKKKQKIPLPDLPEDQIEAVDDAADFTEEDEPEYEIPEYTEEEEEREYEKLIKREELKLKKLEEKEEEINDLYCELVAADSMLTDVINHKEKGIYEAMVERHLSLLVKNLKYEEIKNSLVKTNVIIASEVKEMEERYPKDEYLESLVTFVLQKGDYACKQFILLLSEKKQFRKVHQQLLGMEKWWRHNSWETLRSTSVDVEPQWSKLVSTVEPLMLCSILTNLEQIDESKENMVKSGATAEERRGALLPIVNQLDQEQWPVIIQNIQDQEHSLEDMLSSWDASDPTGNWNIILDALSIDIVLKTMLFKYIVSPRQYSQLTKTENKDEMLTSLKDILANKSRQDWEMFITSMKNSGYGHFIPKLHEKQIEWLNRPPEVEFEPVDHIFGFKLASSGFSREPVNRIVYTHFAKKPCIFLGLPELVEVYEQDETKWKKLYAFKGLPFDYHFIIDEERRKLVYGAGRKIISLPIMNKKNRKSELIADIPKEGFGRIKDLQHSRIHSRYVALGTEGMCVLIDKETESVTSSVRIDALCVTQFPSGQMLGLNEDKLFTFDLTGEVDELANLPEGTGSIQGFTINHKKEVFMIDTENTAILMLVQNSQVVKAEAKGSVSYLHVGADGCLVMAYKNGFCAVYEHMELVDLDHDAKLKALGYTSIVPKHERVNPSVPDDRKEPEAIYKLICMTWKRTGKTIYNMQYDFENDILYTIQKGSLSLYKVSKDKIDFIEKIKIHDIKTDQITIASKCKKLMYIKDGQVQEADYRSNRKYSVLNFGKTTSMLAYSQSIKAVLCLQSDGNSIKIFDEISHLQKSTLDFEGKAITYISDAPNGRILVVSKKELMVCDDQGNIEHRYTLNVSKDPQEEKLVVVTSAALLDTQDVVVASPSLPRGLLRMSARDGLQYAPCPGDKIDILTTGPGDTLIAATKDGTICLYSNVQQ